MVPPGQLPSLYSLPAATGKARTASNPAEPALAAEAAEAPAAADTGRRVTRQRSASQLEPAADPPTSTVPVPTKRQKLSTEDAADADQPAVGPSDPRQGGGGSSGASGSHLPGECHTFIRY